MTCSFCGVGVVAQRLIKAFNGQVVSWDACAAEECHRRLAELHVTPIVAKLVDLGRYPHKCPSCGAASYNGLTVEHSANASECVLGK